VCVCVCVCVHEAPDSEPACCRLTTEAAGAQGKEQQDKSGSGLPGGHRHSGRGETGGASNLSIPKNNI